MAEMEPELSIVTPFFNEQTTLLESAQRVLALHFHLELLLCDDGSTDTSGSLADDLAREFPERVRVFHLGKNRGKGAAVRVGIEQARGKVVVIHDADLEYDPQDLVLMLKEMRRLKAPVIHGSRRLRFRSHAAQARYYWGGVALTWVTNLLFGSTLTDEPTCYKMWERQLIQSIPLQADGFEFCPEVTARILRRGHKIPEIQIGYRPRSVHEGKKLRFRDGIIAIFTLLRVRCFG